jgi:oligopeptide/dipeptide ABC transporter ATP-binding protein
MAEGMEKDVQQGASAAPPAAAAPRLLRVEDLSIWFHLRGQRVRAIDDISFTVGRGECVAIVGESGSGKSITALSVLRLVATPPAEVEAGAMLFEDTDLFALSESQMRKVRGRDISMIFQEPMTSLHPILRVGKQITETLALHTQLTKDERRARAVELLRLVGIPDPEQRLGEYPHQLSGGMRQRVMIAIALACNPKLLIADEPTTALDVTIQAQILDLIRSLRQRLGMAILLITHDMGVVAENADRVLVMYAGRIVEAAAVGALFSRPLHPYTAGLMASIPRIGQPRTGPAVRERLNEIPGLVPSLRERPQGCSFAPRCRYATDRCRREEPPLAEQRPGHRTACWEWERLAGEAS